MNRLQSNRPAWLLLLLLWGSMTNALAQSSLFSFEQYQSADGDTLNYRQLVSDYDPVSKYPLVIFLHGSGERGSDNEAQLKWGVMHFATARNMKRYHPIVIAPQCPEKMSWANFSFEDGTLKPTPSKPMKLVIELIHQVMEQYPVDPHRIYITGLSMGGIGTFDALSRYPNLFAAAVPVCGAGDPSKASTFAHIPIWIFHGAMDQTVDVDYAHKMVEALTKAGAHPGLTQYPGTGHFSWIAAYSDTMMMDWLFNQRKAAPQK